MIGIYVLLGFAAAMLVAAVFIYSKSDTNNFELVLEKVGNVQMKVDATAKAVETERANSDQIVKDMAALFDQISQFQIQLSNAKHDWGTETNKMKSEFEIISVRQRTLEKRVSEVKNRTVNLNLSNPIMVDLIEKVKAPPGKGVGALLKQSGVVQTSSPSTKDH